MHITWCHTWWFVCRETTNLKSAKFLCVSLWSNLPSLISAKFSPIQYVRPRDGKRTDIDILLLIFFRFQSCQSPAVSKATAATSCSWRVWHSTIVSTSPTSGDHSTQSFGPRIPRWDTGVCTSVIPPKSQSGYSVHWGGSPWQICSCYICRGIRYVCFLFLPHTGSLVHTESFTTLLVLPLSVHVV